MAASTLTAIQSNPIPAGGTTATQPVPPSMTPADIAALTESLQPIQSRFRAVSSFLKVPLNQLSFTALGQSKSTQITSVGLGVRLVTEWNVTITVTNAATSAQTFSVSPLFPYNLISNTQVQINGGATVFSAGGLATYLTMTRQRRGSRRLTLTPANQVLQFGPQIDASLIPLNTLQTTQLTGTATGALTPSFTGVASVSVVGSGTGGGAGTWILRFYTIEKLCLDKNSLLGALPLQNNSTFANLTRSIVGSLSTTRNDLSVPFYSALGNLTFALTTCTADSTYVFCSVPSDPSLYAAMIANSYQIQEATALTVAAAGNLALVYNIPQNEYLVAAHIMAVDNNGAAVARTTFTRLVIQYNGGSIVPIVEFAGRQRAEAYLDYDFDLMTVPGLVEWDGEVTVDDVTSSDDMGWLNAYDAATPQLGVDIATGGAFPYTYNVIREAVIAGSVAVVGG